MFVPLWAISVTVAVVIGLLAYVLWQERPWLWATWKRQAAGPLNPYRNDRHGAVIERLRQNLRVKTMYREDVIDRLIQLERERLPNASLQTLMETAIQRWERDNR